MESGLLPRLLMSFYTDPLSQGMHMTNGRSGRNRRTLPEGTPMTWRHTFQTRIAGVLALLLLVVVAATYFAVQAATSRAPGSLTAGVPASLT